MQRVLQDAAGITLVGVAACAEEVIALVCAALPTVILLYIAIAKSLAIARHFARTPKVGGVVIVAGILVTRSGLAARRRAAG